MTSSQQLAARLPDLPRWVEVRDLLLADEATVYGWQTEPELAAVARETDGQVAFVIGAPDLAAVMAAVRGLAGEDSGLIAPEAVADRLLPALPGWRRTRIRLHTLPDLARLPSAEAGQVEFIDVAVLDGQAIEEELLGELRSGAQHSLLAATHVSGQPVAFCYVSSQSETWWDIAVDTLPAHWRRGYAGLAVTHMIRHMQTQGKQPVWQAVEDNPASWRLAEKLGFVQIDELALFQPPE